jgi:hypothetical protein
MRMNWVAAAIGTALLFLYSSSGLARHGHAAYRDDAAILAACPIKGDAKSARVQSLNVLKRRMTTPESTDVDSKVTLVAMVAPGEDVSRFDTNKAATISGYVADVKVSGVESVNCHTHNPKYRDTHIELTLDPMHYSENKHVIIEVTPQWRQAMAAKGVDWNTSTLRQQLLGRWIKVTGWLLYDEEHTNAAENTNPGGRKNWRATVWEIHPITDIQVLPGKP